MKQVVKVDNDEPRAGTKLIADGFKRQHKDVLKLVHRYEKRFLRYGDLKRKTLKSGEKGGRPGEEFLLNQGQFMFLGTLFRNSNDEVLDFKENLVAQFIELRDRLIKAKAQRGNKDWNLARDFGKESRRLETYAIKEFVEYAKAQGSRSAQMYYNNITRMMNGLLFIAEGKFKNLRDVATPQQLMTISSAEVIITKGLRDGMKAKIFYKEIYKDVKSRVMQFAELHGQTKIIEDQLKLDGME